MELIDQPEPKFSKMSISDNGTIKITFSTKL